MSSIPRIGRLLVVDDEPELVAALCEILQSEGFEVVGYTNPVTALDALRTDGHDLVLSDLMMPGMDGIRFLQQALVSDPQLVGVIMTGQGSIRAAVEAMQAGASRFRPQAVPPKPGAPGPRAGAGGPADPSRERSTPA